jgi:hypothetical protein
MSVTRFVKELVALRVRNAGRALRSFYAEPVAWVALVVTAGVLAYRRRRRDVLVPRPLPG